MSFTSYHIPTNDAQMDAYSRAIPELATNDINMEYVDYWLNLTVEKEINRGARLAEEKLRLYPLSQDECGINIDFIKPIPTCSKIKRYSSHRKCSQRQYTDVRLHSCNRRQNSLYFEPNSCTPQSCYSKQNIAKLRPRIPRCPMRVAELAVPTKRQCIDTWRNKCDVLPEFMVERLKQQVMNEKPVVKISDALTCFKHRKSSFNRSRLKTCTIAAMNLRNEDFRKYSATFSHKIAQKLNIPFNITLNPQLEKISNVVSSDISRLTKHQKKINTKNAKNKKIQIEMSSKIAAWIANIVEESSYKMIEADLRELEEEEGPVLDFIDSLVHNVVSICEDFSEKDDLHPALYTNIASPVSYENIHFETRSRSETGESEKVMGRNDSIQTTSGEMESNVESSNHNKIEDNLELDSNEEYILEELERIVDSVTITAQPDKQNTIADMIKTEDYLGVDKMSRQSIDSTSSYVQFKQSNNSQGFVKEYQEFSENSKDADNNFSANQENDNVSELFQIHSEESPDVKSRKINFLQLIANKVTEELGNPDDIRRKAGTQKTEQVSWKLPIKFAAPNENLLSHADESWPTDISTPTLKASESVSKSITSLGKIIENDEQLLYQEDIAKQIIDELEETLNSENTKTSNDNTTKEKICSENNLRYEKDNNTNVDPENETRMPELEITKSNMSEYTRNTTAATPKTMIGTNNNNYTNEINLMFMPVTQPISKKPSVKILIDEYNLNKNKDTGGEKNVILGTVQNKLNLAHGIQETKFQYRVNPYTAPPWVRQDHGKGEPSENSFNYESRAKLQMKECDIRKWNKDLKAINANLDLWHVWLQTTCKNIIWLKKYSEMNKLCSPGIIKENTRNWVNLKKDMDKDIMMWTTLNKQTQKRLKTYKTTNEKYGKQILSVEQNVLKCSCKKRRM